MARNPSEKQCAENKKVKVTDMMQDERCPGIKSQIKIQACTHTAVCTVRVYWEHWGTWMLQDKGGPVSIEVFLVHLCQVVRVSADLAVVCPLTQPPNGPHPLPSCIKHSLSKRPTVLLLLNPHKIRHNFKNHSGVTPTNECMRQRIWLTLKKKQPFIICTLVDFYGVCCRSRSTWFSKAIANAYEDIQTHNPIKPPPCAQSTI